MSGNSNEQIFEGNQIGQCYVVSVYDDMEDAAFEQLCKRTIEFADQLNVLGVIFDFVNTNIIDSFLIENLIRTTKTIELVGRQVVWVGLRPTAIASILNLTIDLDGILIGQVVQDGVDMINKNASEMKTNI